MTYAAGWCSVSLTEVVRSVTLIGFVKPKYHQNEGEEGLETALKHFRKLGIRRVDTAHEGPCPG